MGYAMKESPITPYHRSKGAILHNEEGWRMPGTYSDIWSEHQAVRYSCGIFDISHLGKFRICGQGAESWLESMLSNTVRDCRNGHGQRTLMLNNEGGIIDRLTLFRETHGCFRLLGSAALAYEDFLWLSAQAQHSPFPLQLYDETDQWSGMAVYGPKSHAIFYKIFPDLSPPSDMQILHPLHNGEELIITSCGLEGDKGFELFCAAHQGVKWFETFVQAGALPCGLAARECLRLERHKVSAGRDMNSKTTPTLAGLSHLCTPNKSYVGSSRLQRGHTPFSHKVLTLLECSIPSQAPRHGYTVKNLMGHPIGCITSGCISPTTGLGIGFAYLSSTHAIPGTPLHIIINNAPVLATVSFNSVS